MPNSSASVRPRNQRITMNGGLAERPERPAMARAESRRRKGSAARRKLLSRIEPLSTSRALPCAVSLERRQPKRHRLVDAISAPHARNRERSGRCSHPVRHCGKGLCRGRQGAGLNRQTDPRTASTASPGSRSPTSSGTRAARRRPGLRDHALPAERSEPVRARGSIHARLNRQPQPFERERAAVNHNAMEVRHVVVRVDSVVRVRRR
jgi:hypothetical protein